MEAVGEEGQTEILLVTPIPIMAKLVYGQTTSAHSISAGHGPQVKARGMPRIMVRAAFQTRRTPVHFSVSDVKVGATWLVSVPPQPSH